MKKYELTEETLQCGERVLHRIRAVAAFGNIKAGDPGGWIEQERNLSHEGDAWVCGNARVYGDAWVSDNAWVYGNAQVYDDARVSGSARVYGDAWVSDDTQVSGAAAELRDIARVLAITADSDANIRGALARILRVADRLEGSRQQTEEMQG